jgi:cytochrome c553
MLGPYNKHKAQGRNMQVNRITRALQTTIIAALTVAAGLTDSTQAKTAPGGLKAKIEFCKTCHGASGEGFRGYYTAPRLAGQTTEYLESQFKAFAAHTRDNPAAKQFMVPVASGLDPATRTALAKYFSGLNAGPAGGGPRNLVAAGKKIYDDGVPEANVPACSACHGPDAKGIEIVPRLAGQMYTYTVAQLTGWGKGLRAKNPESPNEQNTMVPISTSLSKEQISAVAAYISTLR